MDDIAYIYLELMDRLALDQVDVIGCSIGGWIAAEIATKIAGTRSQAGAGRPGGREDRADPTGSTFPTSSRCHRASWNG